jgi:hypothetical protein
MVLLEQDIFLVIGETAGLGSASSAVGGRGGRVVPFLCVAPLSYPQPGRNAGIVPGEFSSYSGQRQQSR